MDSSADRPRIIFLCHDGTGGSVFASQVVAPMRRLKEETGMDVTLVVFNRLEDFLSPRKIRRAKEILAATGLKTLLLPRLPFLIRGLVGLHAHLLMPRLTGASQKIIFHCRGPFASWIGLSARHLLARRGERASVIYDCRGDTVAEYAEYRGKGSPLYKLRLGQLARLEKAVLLGADHVLAVSAALESRLRDFFGWTGPCTITPSPAGKASLFVSDGDREKTRRDLGLSDRIVLVYSGSLLGWQMPDKLVEIFKEFHSRDPRCFFLVLTPDRDAMLGLLRTAEVGGNDFRVLSLGHGELPRHIACGDAALLLRENNWVNRVASPTKFVEYLGAGVPVFLTRGVGDTEKVVEGEKCGWLVDGLSDPVQIRGKIGGALADLGQGKTDRARLAGIAEKFYSLQSHLARLFRVYASLEVKLKPPKEN